jgi:biopolymer transport protein ExbD
VAEKLRTLDVWVVDTNTVYSKVPYTVVSDWIQQGRLLASDRIKASGTTAWLLLSDVPEFTAYLPQAASPEAEDQAEALEPVEMGFSWKPAKADEDEDVDMIPLIDVSLVLLIFFMMTTTVGTAASLIKIPKAVEGTQVKSDAGMLWIGIDRGADNRPFYSIGQGDSPPAEGDRRLDNQQLLIERFKLMSANKGPFEVRILANGQLPFELVKKMTVALERFKAPSGLQKIYAAVGEGERP